ncbi:MAG: protein tyrosine phosphatase family protein [Halioglobus sp.]|nr:protein tyrosine phosphatase family protein [Halioglobus sp.]
MSVDEAYNYKKVSDTTCTAGRLSEQQLGILKQEGYEAVINLLPDDSQYALPGERELIEQQGLDYQYIPVDFGAPQERDYSEFERALQALGDRKAMIHCAANYRVSAFYAIYAHRNLGWSSQKSGEHIASLWNPAEHPPWDTFIARMLQVSGE